MTLHAQCGAIAALMALGYGPLAYAGAADHGAACTNEPSHLAGPFVSDAETAKTIFLAVEKSRAPQADIKQYPVVEALDEGDHWSVFRYKKTGAGPDGKVVVVTNGGGQLEMDIDKCSGAISHVALSR